MKVFLNFKDIAQEKPDEEVLCLVLLLLDKKLDGHKSTYFVNTYLWDMEYQDFVDMEGQGVIGAKVVGWVKNDVLVQNID